MYQDRQTDGKLDYVTVRRWMDIVVKSYIKVYLLQTVHRSILYC